ncbi:MAG: glycosyltransferase family 4 protein [Gemmataceae bacterium]|nr:glycosyltransferase family 4 protein [Gemmataceae bacterium]
MPGKVLLIAVDPIPEHGCPTSGGGLRAWSLFRALRDAGFDVACSIPRPEITFLSRKCWDRVPRAMKEIAWDWENQGQVIKKLAPDVVVYSSNVCNVGIHRKPHCPVVIDLHGPFMLESWFMKQTASEHTFQYWRDKLALGDLFLTVSQKQQRFFWSWLLASGVEFHDGAVLPIAPISMSPNLPPRPERQPQEPVFVFGGGFFPWTDPSDALLNLVDVLEQRDKGKLWAFTDFHNLDASRQRFAVVRDRLTSSSHVHFPGLLGRDELMKAYAQADVAIDLMKRNPERELAVTTRTIEYLWCGLPVIYNDYAELATPIRRYNAGWCVDPEDPVALRRVLDHILDHPEKLPEYGRNAQRLVRDHFTWDKAMRPLIDFCAHPQARKAAA